MKKAISILTILIISLTANSQEIKKFVGNWRGELDVNGNKLELIYKLTMIDDTTLMGLIDIPEQFAYNIEVQRIYIYNDTIELKNFDLNMKFKGFVNRSVIVGKYKQGRFRSKLILQNDINYKIKDFKRPQTPKPPFNYEKKIVSFVNETDKAKLAATLTYPKGEGKFPAVVLISGSGPQNRDSELYLHKPFAVIADYLTKNGIAVLRYDDRGYGESTGVYEHTTTKGFANDAAAAFEFLKSQKNIDKKQIGLIGHSEGGLVAMMNAANNKDIAFIVLLASPGINTDKSLLRQTLDVSNANGIDTSIINRNQRINTELYQIVQNEHNVLNANKQMHRVFDKYSSNLSDEEKQKLGLDKGYVNSLIKQAQSAWFRYYICIKPDEHLSKIKKPVLAINGTTDLQVNAEENLNGIKQSLEKAGNNNFEIVKLDGLNHLLQHSETGLPQQYKDIEETISPEVLEKITTWIKSNVK